MLFKNFKNIKRVYSKFSFCDSINDKNIEQNFLKLDYYSILNINKNSSDIELKKSYFLLAKKFHPDKFKGSSEIFRKISEAYNILRDPTKREEYNKRLKIKLRRKYKQATENPAEKMQKNSKYEDEFKKLNIDKLFIQFTHRKIKTSPNEIKVINNLIFR